MKLDGWYAAARVYGRPPAALVIVKFWNVVQMRQVKRRGWREDSSGRNVWEGKIEAYQYFPMVRKPATSEWEVKPRATVWAKAWSHQESYIKLLRR